MFIRPCEGRITSRFQPGRLDPVGKEEVRDHVGVDIAKAGTVPILAALDGKVTLARSKDSDGFGFVIFMEHFDDKGKILFTTVYAHLSKIFVSAGRTVKRGTKIANMGKTGNSTGQHLHFEIHIGKRVKGNRNAVDAMMYLPLEVALKKGDKGPSVKMMQDLLVKKDYLSAADSSFGPTTEKAIKAYQNKNRMVVDGSVGPATMAKLKKDDNSKPSVPTPSKKEIDEMTKFMDEKLPIVQREDAEKLFKHAYEKGYFSTNHAPKVKNMTRRQFYDLKLSYDIREVLNK